MQKIVITEHIDFELSEAAVRAYAERKGLTLHEKDETTFWQRYWLVPLERRPPADASLLNLNQCMLNISAIARDDPDLVAVIEAMGEAADGEYGKLKVVEIPDGIKWYVQDLGGCEIIHEEHRTWS